MSQQEIDSLVEGIRLLMHFGFIEGVLCALGTIKLIDLVFKYGSKLYYRIRPVQIQDEENIVIFDEHLAGDIQRFLDQRAEYYGYAKRNASEGRINA
jgi:hypothetical protein